MGDGPRSRAAPLIEVKEIEVQEIEVKEIGDKVEELSRGLAGFLPVRVVPEEVIIQ